MLFFIDTFFRRDLSGRVGFEEYAGEISVETVRKYLESRGLGVDGAKDNQMEGDGVINDNHGGDL